MTKKLTQSEQSFYFWFFRHDLWDQLPLSERSHR